MTREEAIKELYKLEYYGKSFDNSVEECRKAERKTEAIWVAIKALKQEPILDKIRAEIDKIYESEGNSVDCLNALDDLKWFIDKYKAESEDKRCR